MEKANDNELLYLILENDDDARDYLMKKYEPLILANIKKLAIGKDEADDFFQEGLIALNKAITTYNSNYYQSFNRYFSIILKRRFIDLLRKKKHSNKIAYINDLEDYIVDTINYDLPKTINEEDLKLSSFEQIIFTKRFIEQVKPKMIATELNCNIKQVYDAIDRIRKKARKNNLNG